MTRAGAETTCWSESKEVLRAIELEEEAAEVFEYGLCALLSGGQDMHSCPPFAGGLIGSRREGTHLMRMPVGLPTTRAGFGGRSSELVR
jgi:hypothetical protein